MRTIPQKELRNQVGEVLRRVESGERITVTVSGRPVAELCPVHKHRWVSGTTLARVWSGPAPHDLEQDLERLDLGLTEPFEK